MNFKSQICTTREQSERLLALGLKKETADMYITDMSSKGINYTDDWKIGSISYCSAISFLNSQGLQLEKTAWSIIPAWSLHRLIEMMPSTLQDLKINFSKRGIDYTDFSNGSFNIIQSFASLSKTLYDNIIDCIEWLINEGYFNKEYLN